MKNRVLLVISLCQICISAYLFQIAGEGSEPGKDRYLPVPGDTRVLRKEEESEEEEHRKRREWIERIHRTAPGVDWRDMDRQTRMEKYLSALSSSSRSSGGSASIADGFLEGNWIEKGSGNLAGRTRMADYDTLSEKIYLVSDGGNVWRGNTDGTNWEVLNDRLQFEDPCMIRVIRRNGLFRILVGTWGKLAYYSDDAGETWQVSDGFQNLNGGNQRIERMVVADDENATVYALVSAPATGQTGTHHFIYRSVNQGQSFAPYFQIPGSQNVSIRRADVWTAHYGNSAPYVLFNNKLFRINTADSTLEERGQLEASNVTDYVMLTGYRSNTGEVLLYAYFNKSVYRSSDEGLSWTLQMNLDRDPFYKTSFSASVNTPDILYFGDIECYRSNNGGQGFQRINEWFEYYDNVLFMLHADIPSVNCLRRDDGSEFQLINTDGGIYYSNNNLIQVRNISMQGLHISQYYSSLTAIYDTSMLFIGSQDQGYQRSLSENGGVRNFEQVVSGDYGHLVSGNDGGSLWMVYPGFAIFYPNSASSESASWEFDGNNIYWMPPLMADPFIETQCYLANGNRIIKLQYGGNQLNASYMPGFFAGGISAMAYSPVDNNRWYVLTEEGKFYTSVNGGDSWTSTTLSGPPGANYLYGNCILPSTVNPDVVYISGSGYSNAPVYKSVNNGASFSAMASGLPSTMVFRLAAAPNDEFIFAATEVGPYVYVPGENQWYDLSGDVAPDQSYWWVEYIPSMKTARFSTYGRGVWDFRISSPLSAQAPTAGTFSVFPNPAMDQIQLKGLPAGNVQIKLYDLSGKLVFTTNVATANATVSGLGNLPKGMYVLVSEQGKWRKGSKLILR